MKTAFCAAILAFTAANASQAQVFVSVGTPAYSAYYAPAPVVYQASYHSTYYPPAPVVVARPVVYGAAVAPVAVYRTRYRPVLGPVTRVRYGYAPVVVGY